MARLSDGRIGFVTGAFPGDVIEATRVEVEKRFARAVEWTLVEPSAHRVPPACPIAEKCGGCDWMGLARNEQIAAKEDVLVQALERTGKFETIPKPLTVTRAGGAHGYRRRVRLHVDEAGNLGFFARGSHDVVDVEHCLVCDPRLDVALTALRELSREHLAGVEEIELRVGDEAGDGERPSSPSVSIHLFPRRSAPPSKASRKALRARLKRFDVHFDGDPIVADRDQSFELPGGVRLLASPGVFTQVNWDVNRALVESVVAGALARNISRFCDAYAGAGNFSLALLRAGLEGKAVERDAPAIACARRAAASAGLDTDAFFAGDAAPFLRSALRRRERFDLILLDPPRRGAKEVLDTVVLLAPRHVAICSCDPVTLARDLGTLARNGYALDEVRGFDMFPETHHFETLAWMSRTPVPES